MNPEQLIAALTSIPRFATIPRAELEWVAAHSTERLFAGGTTMFEKGAPMDEMFILLSGQVSAYSSSSGGSHILLSMGAGEIGGAIPYSRMLHTPALIFAEEDTQVLAVDRALFPELIRECPALMEALVHFMVDRARNFYGAQLNQDRLQSLGRLASGLAHELNNPASAATRGAQLLAGQLDAAEKASVELAALQLNAAQLETVVAVRRACAQPALARGALEAADHEDDIVDWLTRHKIDSGFAVALAACDIDVAALERLKNELPAASLDVVVAWIASGISARELAREVGLATGRIHDLVSSVKGFTFMDREGVPESVDVARGLADTISVLENKARGKSVAVQLETADNLPHVHGFGSEINQVWEKIVDNAIDAVAARGNITITATARGESIVVRVADDGPGIPEKDRAKVFDPFFTTKGVGQGTGLGLDIARRTVHAHHGDIDFTSQPGRTVFRVRLPVSGIRTA